jgi:thioesterase domain-containing protein
MTFLLLHGALGDHPTREPLRAHLDRPRVAIDVEGHGALAPATGPLRLARFVEQTITWLTEHGPAHLFGYSMGGYVALVAGERPLLDGDTLAASLVAFVTASG